MRKWRIEKFYWDTVALAWFTSTVLTVDHPEYKCAPGELIERVCVYDSLHEISLYVRGVQS